MSTKTTLSISEARKNIFKIAKRVQKTSQIYTLTEGGRPSVVLMSAEEFEAWQETFAVRMEYPDLLKDVKKIRQDIRSEKSSLYRTLNNVKKRLQPSA